VPVLTNQGPSDLSSHQDLEAKKLAALADMWQTIAAKESRKEAHDGSFVGPYQVSRRERKDDRSNEEG